jgi:hypothetical protein
MNVRDYPTLKLVRKDIDVNERERLSLSCSFTSISFLTNFSVG